MLADELDALQAIQNDSRGISCVRPIVFEFRRNNIGNVRAIIDNEWDKIRSYPTIVAWLKEKGFVNQTWI